MHDLDTNQYDENIIVAVLRIRISLKAKAGSGSLFFQQNSKGIKIFSILESKDTLLCKFVIGSEFRSYLHRPDPIKFKVAVGLDTFVLNRFYIRFMI